MAPELSDGGDELACEQCDSQEPLQQGDIFRAINSSDSTLGVVVTGDCDFAQGKSWDIATWVPVVPLASYAASGPVFQELQRGLTQALTDLVSRINTERGKRGLPALDLHLVTDQISNLQDDSLPELLGAPAGEQSPKIAQAQVMAQAARKASAAIDACPPRWAAWSPTQITSVLDALSCLLVARGAQPEKFFDRLTNLLINHADDVFFLYGFASIIRRASNADPVPVSGLEVTAHMRRLDEAGRTVNPFLLFEGAIRASVDAFAEFWADTPAGFAARVYRADARSLADVVPVSPDVVITSPPYHGAVDYYRRHTLESYWLDFAGSLEERQKLLPRYIGRAKVTQAHDYANTSLLWAPYAHVWEKRMRRSDACRADAFKHYALAMHAVIAQLARALRPKSRAVFVLGNSRWNGQQIDTGRLLSELAQRTFALEDRFWYPLKNRYMSYSRHNGASIDREHVLVFRRLSGTS